MSIKLNGSEEYLKTKLFTINYGSICSKLPININDNSILNWKKKQKNKNVNSKIAENKAKNTLKMKLTYYIRILINDRVTFTFRFFITF